MMWMIDQNGTVDVNVFYLYLMFYYYCIIIEDEYSCYDHHR